MPVSFSTYGWDPGESHHSGSAQQQLLNEVVRVSEGKELERIGAAQWSLIAG